MTAAENRLRAELEQANAELEHLRRKAELDLQAARERIAELVTERDNLDHEAAANLDAYADERQLRERLLRSLQIVSLELFLARSLERMNRAPKLSPTVSSAWLRWLERGTHAGRALIQLQHLRECRPR